MPEKILRRIKKIIEKEPEESIEMALRNAGFVHKEVEILLNIFKRKRKKSVNRQLTNIICPDFKIVFREGAIENIKKTLGFKNDAEFARALQLTRAYVCLLKAKKAKVTDTVITRVATITNNHDRWWVHFELEAHQRPLNSNHPMYNNEKYMGRMPYEKYSQSAEFRKNDYDAETKNNA